MSFIDYELMCSRQYLFCVYQVHDHADRLHEVVMEPGECNLVEIA